MGAAAAIVSLIVCVIIFCSVDAETRRGLCWCFILLTILLVIFVLADPTMLTQK